MLKHFPKESNASLSAFKKKKKNTQGMMWDISEQNTRGENKNAGAWKNREEELEAEDGDRELSGKQARRFWSVNPKGWVLKWCESRSRFFCCVRFQWHFNFMCRRNNVTSRLTLHGNNTVGALSPCQTHLFPAKCEKASDVRAERRRHRNLSEDVCGSRELESNQWEASHRLHIRNSIT